MVIRKVVMNVKSRERSSIEDPGDKISWTIGMKKSVDMKGDIVKVS